MVAGVDLSAQAPPASTPAEFVPLFDGTLDGWVVENTTANNFTVKDRILRVEGPQGWLRSQRQYGDFVLRVEVRLSVTKKGPARYLYNQLQVPEFMESVGKHALRMEIDDSAVQ